ncbi:MAG: hypothetical protein S4CHLAM2_13820 [Chlamydiales bacterium]|nr:hypothetical protein [Chlamydiales bacterium]
MKKLICFLTFLFVPLLHGAVDWTSPLPLLDSHSESSTYSVSINPEGNTLVGYYNPQEKQIDFTGYSFLENKSHSARVRAIPCTGEVSFLEIARDFKDHLFALWVDEGAGTLKAARFRVPTNSVQLGRWMDPFVIPHASTVRNPALRCDGNGNAVVIWEQFNGYEFQVKMAYFSHRNFEWSPVYTLSSLGYDCHSTCIAIDQEGELVVAWCACSHVGENPADGIRAIRMTLDPFEPSEIISQSETRFVLKNPSVGFGPDNTIYVVWERKDRLTGATLVQSFSASSHLHEKGNIRDISGENATSPSLITLQGRAYVLWVEKEGSFEQLKRRGMEPESEVQRIAFPLSKIKGYTLNCDELGKAKILYFNDEQVVVSLFDEKWTNTRLYSRKTPQNQVKNVQVKSDAFGNTLVTWADNDRIFYSQGDYLLPPRNFLARRVTKRFPAKTIVRAHLTWSPATNPSIVGYRIRRNNIVLDETLTTEFMDRCCPRGGLIYSISAINDKGIESQPSQLFFQN